MIQRDVLRTNGKVSIVKDSPGLHPGLFSAVPSIKTQGRLFGAQLGEGSCHADPNAPTTCDPGFSGMLSAERFPFAPQTPPGRLLRFRPSQFAFCIPMIAGLLDVVLTLSALLETLIPLFSISVSSSKFWTPTCDRAIRTGINHEEEVRGTSGDAAKAVLTT